MKIESKIKNIQKSQTPSWMNSIKYLKNINSSQTFLITEETGILPNSFPVKLQTWYLDT